MKALGNKKDGRVNIALSAASYGSLATFRAILEQIHSDRAYVSRHVRCSMRLSLSEAILELCEYARKGVKAASEAANDNARLVEAELAKRKAKA